MATPEVVVLDATGEETSAQKPQMFSDPELISAEFHPVPYVFILKDANGNPIALPPSTITNARVECPKFHVLLDHLMAVLWIFYSKKELDLLGSNQIHWALKILEGTRNRLGQYTEDVTMAIDDLRDAYVDLCAQWNVEKLEERTYPIYLNSTPRPPPSGSDKDKDKDNTADYNIFQLGLQMQNSLPNSFTGSVHLDDMLANEDVSTINEIMNPTGGGASTTPSAYETAVDVEPDNESVRQNILRYRNEQFRKIIDQLEEIQKIDSTLQNVKVQATKDVAVKLAELLKSVGKDG